MENEDKMKVEFDNIEELKGHLVNYYPVRNNQKERTNFRKWLEEYAKIYGFSEIKKLYQYRTHGKRKFEGTNVIVGNLERADIVLTAHYDTPSVDVFRSYKAMYKKNKFVCLVSWIVPSIWLLLIIFEIYCFFKEDLTNVANICILLIIGAVFLLILILILSLIQNILGYPNKNNSNDNTSGILTLLNIMNNLSNDKKVCFIFFDQEELFKRGSKKFYRKNADKIKSKLLINFDCVGDGDTFYFITDDEKFKCTRIYDILKNSIDKKSNFIFRTTKDYTFTSDHNSFPKNGIGVKAAKSEKNGEGFNYGSEKYHTWYDTELDEKNINALSNTIVKFISKLEEN